MNDRILAILAEFIVAWVVCSLVSPNQRAGLMPRKQIPCANNSKGEKATKKWDAWQLSCRQRFMHQTIGFLICFSLSLSFTHNFQIVSRYREMRELHTILPVNVIAPWHRGVLHTSIYNFANCFVSFFMIIEHIYYYLTHRFYFFFIPILRTSMPLPLASAFP